jgi:hypothetical protein
MRWPWQHPPRVCLLPGVHSPRPDLWTDAEWAEELVREQEAWNRTVGPALADLLAADRAVAAALSELASVTVRPWADDITDPTQVGGGLSPRPAED